MSLPSYAVWFRGRPACPCLAEWLPVFEAELIRRGVIKQSIDIAQLIGGADASAGTHSSGGAFDIWQHDDVTIWVARQMGADATWARTTGSFATNRHAHGVLTGCPHNGAARYQIDEVRAGGDGLVGTAPDPGPRPLSGRTWRQGIEWAREQGGLTMDEEVKAAFTALRNQNNTILKRLGAKAALRSNVARLLKQGKASREDLRKLQRDVDALDEDDDPGEP